MQGAWAHDDWFTPDEWARIGRFLLRRLPPNGRTDALARQALEGETVPLIDEAYTHVYSVKVSTVVSTCANPAAADAEIRQALLENLRDWIDAAGDYAAGPDNLTYELIESIPDEEEPQ